MRHDSDIPECPVTPEHTRDYFHTLFYIVYIPGSGAMSGTKLTPNRALANALLGSHQS